MREFGIRLSLGASARDIWRLVVSGSLATLGWSLTLGMVAPALFTRYLRSESFEIGPADPVTLALVFVVIAVAALCGYALPAGRQHKWSR